MKKAAQWIFGMMFAVALLLPMQHCYAYEGESEEEWVNRMWYDTQWTFARVRFPEYSHVIGHSRKFSQFGELTGYRDVMPWTDSGIIEYVDKNGVPWYVEILAGGAANMYGEVHGEWEYMFSFLNMAVKRDRNHR